MTFSFKTPELKFTDSLLNFFELLGLEGRKDMAGKSAIGILLLKKEKTEKEAFLKQEIRSRIRDINDLLDATLVDMFIFLIKDLNNPVDSYAELFKDDLRKGLNIEHWEYEKYENSVKKVESMLDSSDKNFPSKLLYRDAYERKREILQLPKIKQLVDVLVYLHHIDLLHKNLQAVKDDIPPDFDFSNDGATKKIIKAEFKAMDSDKGWNYAFRNKKDYENYCTILTDYFELKDPQPFQEIINLKPNTQTRVSRALKNIFNELGDGVFKNQVKFFKLIRLLSHFKEMGDPKIYDTLTK